MDTDNQSYTDNTCYLCYEKETSENKFCGIICDCIGYFLHKNCFQKLYNKSICSICKSKYKNIQDLLPHRDGMLILIEIDKYGIKHEYTKNEDGLKHGLCKIFYPNGEIWEENIFVNGIKEGIQKLYTIKGQLHTCFIYKDGELIEEYNV